MRRYLFTLTGACLFLFLCPPAHGQTSSKTPCGDPQRAAEFRIGQRVYLQNLNKQENLIAADTKAKRALKNLDDGQRCQFAALMYDCTVQLKDHAARASESRNGFKLLKEAERFEKKMSKVKVGSGHRRRDRGPDQGRAEDEAGTSARRHVLPDGVEEAWCCEGGSLNQEAVSTQESPPRFGGLFHHVLRLLRLHQRNTLPLRCSGPSAEEPFLWENTFSHSGLFHTPHNSEWVCDLCRG
jgi:hypothetical protein